MSVEIPLVCIRDRRVRSLSFFLSFFPLIFPTTRYRFPPLLSFSPFIFVSFQPSYVVASHIMIGTRYGIRLPWLSIDSGQVPTLKQLAELFSKCLFDLEKMLSLFSICARKSNNYSIAKSLISIFIVGRHRHSNSLLCLTFLGPPLAHQITNDRLLFIELVAVFTNLNGKYSKKMVVGRRAIADEEEARKRKEEMVQEMLASQSH